MCIQWWRNQGTSLSNRQNPSLSQLQDLLICNDTGNIKTSSADLFIPSVFTWRRRWRSRNSEPATVFPDADHQPPASGAYLQQTHANMFYSIMVKLLFSLLQQVLTFDSWRFIDWWIIIHNVVIVNNIGQKQVTGECLSYCTAAGRFSVSHASDLVSARPPTPPDVYCTSPSEKERMNFHIR